ncbi:MAG TPA: NAD(P)-dependent oxidoreductase [Acidimicrobiales bacterium]|nr:NAD(P)-dependent oxidoreductase [Acidimicrobiales bacterium]
MSGTGGPQTGRTDDRPAALITAACRGPGLDLLRELCDVTYDPWIDQQPLRIWDGAKLAERVDEIGATVLVCEADFVSGEVLERPLRVIGSTRGDPTNVDVAAATAKGIPVLRTPGRNADGVAELAIALLFAVTRHILPGDRDVRRDQIFSGGSIPYQRYRAWQVAGRTVGIVGLGAVGRAARWRFEGLGMRVISFDPYSDEATHDDLDTMLGEADVVSMHAAPTPETLGMMGEKQFAAMREGACYLNTARAGLHDLDALVAALRSGHLGGAGLDHFDGERLPTDHPLVAMDNVVLTPHIGGATYDTETNHTAMIAEDVRRILSGERPLHCVNPEVLP